LIPLTALTVPKRLSNFTVNFLMSNRTSPMGLKHASLL
jgi:hypothetical protein